MPSMKVEVYDLLILGAGPYGLAVAHAAKKAGIEYVVVGSPLSVWREASQGMPLRTKRTAKFDPLGTGLFGTFLHQRGIEEDPHTPISRKLFVEYMEWELTREPLTIVDEKAVAFTQHEGVFVATLSSGTILRATHAVVATGAVPHAYVPQELLMLGLPTTHSVHVHDYTIYAHKTVCVVGGRQSACEAAVLAAEAGARKVYVVYPHETPPFARSQWGWLADEIARVQKGVAFSSLPQADQQAIEKRFFDEGRAKLEPSLEARAQHAAIELVPHTEAVDFLRSHKMDALIAATGFKPDIAHIDFIAPELLSKVECKDGLPILSSSFESSNPGLFFAGILATGTHGPLLEYMHGSAAAAQQIILAIQTASGIVLPMKERLTSTLVEHAPLRALGEVLCMVMDSPLSDFYRRHIGTISFTPGFPHSVAQWHSLPFLTKDQIAEVPVWERTFIPRETVDAIRYTGGTKKRLFTPRRAFGQYGKAAALGGATRMVTFFAALFMSEEERRRAGILLLTSFTPHSPEELTFTAALAKRFAADSLMILPSAAIGFAPYLEAAGALSSIKVLELCGERCSAVQADALRRLYPGVTLVQNYSASDWSGTFGESCSYAIKSGHLSFHIDPTFFYSEFIDPRTTSSVEPSDTPSELVITTITTDQPFPVIRYRTGDLLAVEEAQCPCGDPTPRFKHMGRINPEEMKLFGGEFSLDFVEQALLECDEVLPEDFEVQYIEQSVGAAHIPGLRVLVLPKSDSLNLDSLARLLEGRLRVGTKATYIEGVQSGLLLPLEVGILRVPTRSSEGKRVRFTRAQ